MTAIARINSQSVIIIDDARLFLAPPGAPHEISQWPCFEEVNQALHKLSDDHVLTIFNDTMIFYPGNIREDIKTFFVQTGVDWLSVLDKSRSYDDLLVQLQSKGLEIGLLLKECDRWFSMPGIRKFKNFWRSVMNGRNRSKRSSK